MYTFNALKLRNIGTMYTLYTKYTLKRTPLYTHVYTPKTAQLRRLRGCNAAASADASETQLKTGKSIRGGVTLRISQCGQHSWLRCLTLTLQPLFCETKKPLQDPCGVLVPNGKMNFSELLLRWSGLLWPIIKWIFIRHKSSNEMSRGTVSYNTEDITSIWFFGSLQNYFRLII